MYKARMIVDYDVATMDWSAVDDLSFEYGLTWWYHIPYDRPDTIEFDVKYRNGWYLMSRRLLIGPDLAERCYQVLASELIPTCREPDREERFAGWVVSVHEKVRKILYRPG